MLNFIFNYVGASNFPERFRKPSILNLHSYLNFILKMQIAKLNGMFFGHEPGMYQDFIKGLFVCLFFQVKCIQSSNTL